MERKGSGFGKIIHAYEHQVNFSEDKKPSFRSDRYQFTVVMPNLNYDVPQDVPQENEAGDIDYKIVELIKRNDTVTTEAIAHSLGVSSKTIKRHIKKMPEIKYIGSGYSGHWEVKE